MMVWEAPFSKLCRSKRQTSARQHRFHKRHSLAQGSPLYAQSFAICDGESKNVSRRWVSCPVGPGQPEDEHAMLEPWYHSGHFGGNNVEQQLLPPILTAHPGMNKSPFRASQVVRGMPE